MTNTAYDIMDRAGWSTGSGRRWGQQPAAGATLRRNHGRP